MMVQNYDELYIKAVTYPIAAELDKLSGAFVEIDCTNEERACQDLMNLGEVLRQLTDNALSQIYGLLSEYGYTGMKEEYEYEENVESF